MVVGKLSNFCFSGQQLGKNRGQDDGIIRTVGIRNNRGDSGADVRYKEIA
jgi:hypothetical protein